ncbi:MAG TPA: hypothetical protein VKQ11_05375 [Candidatus Sulfotelmatobacter sp.]|nr:hypothetical protein [Candidatus Sulfotelmatobacter sp.]
MSEPKMKFVQYDAVIADLEAQIAELTTALKAIKRIRSLGVGIGHAVKDTGGVAAPALEVIQHGPSDDDDIRSDAFFRLTIGDAAVKYLRKWAGRRPQSVNTIIDALARGGMKGKGYQTVYKTLVRRAKEKGDVVNVHGDWGLQEWYLQASSSEPAKDA